MDRSFSSNNEKKQINISHLQAYKSKNNRIAKNVLNISHNIKKGESNRIYFNNIVSPNTIKKLKIINIPIGKKKNKNDYNSNTYDGNLNRKRDTNNIRTKFIYNKNLLDYSEINDNENKYHTNSNLYSINANNSYFSSQIYNKLEHFDNDLDILTKGTKQILCYFRIYNKNNIELNLLEKSQNFEIFGFSQGYIFLNLKSEIIKFVQKLNGKELSFKLKDIQGLQIDQYMINIIRINSLFKNNNGEINENKNGQLYNIYNLILRQEKNEISLDQYSKNNAGLCNNFSFNIIIKDLYEGKIECIFNNYELYIFLIKYIENIIESYKNNDINKNNVFNIYNFKSI